MAQQSTLSVNIKWIMEVYSFENSDPDVSSSDEIGSPPKLLPDAIFGTLKTDETINDFVNAVKQSGREGNSPKVLIGINSVSISRSKTTPDARASISFSGPLNDSVYGGAWVIISSVTSVDGGETQLIRFIGQIVGLDATYSVVDGTGLLQQTTTIVCEEWSRILRIPVRYDEIAHEQLLAGAGFAQHTANLVSEGSSKKSADAFQKIAEAAYDPFEMASLILQVIGAMNVSDAVTEFNDTKYPSVALRAPLLPPRLLSRLNAQALTDSPNSPVDPSLDEASSVGLNGGASNPFQNGFVKTFIGQTLEGVNNDGNWDGIFTDDLTLDDYAKKMKEAYKNTRSTRPASMGNVSVIFSGSSAWDLLTTMCDPSLNEVFTDILYEKQGDSIIAKPAIIIRDKPFLPEKLKQKNDLLEKWTSYDNLPRVFVPSESIISMNIKNTILNSPNYIRVQYSGTGHDDGVAKAAATVFGLTRMDPQMDRFGARDQDVQSNYLGINFTDASSVPVSSSVTAAGGSGPQNAGVPSPALGGDQKSGNSGSNKTFYNDWFKTISVLNQAWHSFDYKKGSGSITIKDDSFAISIGFNVQFDFMDHQLLGHVEEVSTQFMIDPIGLELTYTTIKLSNIMFVLSEPVLGASLDFIPPEYFGQLTQKPSISEAVGSGDEISTSVGFDKDSSSLA